MYQGENKVTKIPKNAKPYANPSPNPNQARISPDPKPTGIKKGPMIIPK
jgi:hypothetical protein